MKRKLIFFPLLLIAGLVQSQEVDSASDCFNSFFKKTEKISKKTPVKLIDKSGKISSLTSLLKSETGIEEPKAGLIDLDKDGKKELVIYEYTGGAHCCDVFSVYSNSGNNQYTINSKLFAGNTCISDSIFTYDFYEQFGYFFTCYACSYSEGDSLSGIQHTSSIELIFRNKKLNVRPGTNSLFATVKKNLSILTRLKWDGGPSPELGQDDGRRKDVALNLAVYYYSFGRNLLNTKKLFDQYYHYKDSAKVWSEFSKTLVYIKSDNDF